MALVEWPRGQSVAGGGSDPARRARALASALRSSGRGRRRRNQNPVHRLTLARELKPEAGLAADGLDPRSWACRYPPTFMHPSCIGGPSGSVRVHRMRGRPALFREKTRVGACRAPLRVQAVTPGVAGSSPVSHPNFPTVITQETSSAGGSGRRTLDAPL